MQLKKDGAGNWDVWQACQAIGRVRKVPQNPSYGRGSKPVSGEVLVWGAFTPAGRRVGMDFPTRAKAAEALLNEKSMEEKRAHAEQSAIDAQE